ncbi:hypothetical protein HOLleu_39260 [Holothuria leucospilota]|uniref:Uncharacterized protein n=1 Tax=Holothuria leucospilota TaxID=206669 RepID=A0A9Q0YFS8_HOLLE|nr:hypothetical protein HOLleu_39260 [Holothuria leucospilota]
MKSYFETKKDKLSGPFSPTFIILEKEVTQEDVHWTTNKLVGGVHSYARDKLYKHFEVPEKDVADIRGNLRKEESVGDEVYKVLHRGLRENLQRNRGYLLRKLFEHDENLARGFIEYLFEEMINEINRDADKRVNGGSCDSPPPLYIQNATKDEAACT